MKMERGKDVIGAIMPVTQPGPDGCTLQRNATSGALLLSLDHP